ncbi:hypothetical protein AADEFJLK_02788 [Methylovulum psychrotolerans]|jgi:putative addiction module component (TIGR02574 family)|uniref:Addiction module protein n=2 Tax=Methylovulum psychrotolerans TaxID=1704499 RepID=A0A2S5CKJ5_9GAMM|nr:hypothetical protein AADEFJLK_02788 [Methylovulum psychrotolerans]
MLDGRGFAVTHVEVIKMNRKQLFNEALNLPLADRAALAEQLLASMDPPIREIDNLLALEAERRIDGYERGELRSSPAEQVFNRLEAN